jgi:nucleoside-diphosphate-sugar epimerase
MAASSVFVTGGSGFVGRTLIPFLIQKGYRVKVSEMWSELLLWESI